MSPPLVLDTVAFSYGQSLVARGATLVVAPGEILALIGPNGAGKTTLLKLAAGLLAPSSGRVVARVPAGGVAYLSQADPLPGAFTVREIVELGRLPYVGLLGRLGARDHEAVEDALARTGTAALASRLVETLSGGEQQRVALARALAQRPVVLLLDEPTSHVDPRHQVELFGALRREAAEGVGVVVVVHDLALAGAADRCVLLVEGEVRADGPPAEVLTARTLSAAYGTAMDVLRAPDGRIIALPAIAREGENA